MIFELGIPSIVEERRQANTSNEFKKLHLGLLTRVERNELRDEIY